MDEKLTMKLTVTSYSFVTVLLLFNYLIFSFVTVVTVDLNLWFKNKKL